MKFSQITIGVWVAGLMVFAACQDEAEEAAQPLPSDECPTDHVLFDAEIQPMLSEYCTVCHSGGFPAGGLDFTVYEAVSENAERILGAINHESGFSPMPASQPQIPECERKQFAAWVAQGKPRN